MATGYVNEYNGVGVFAAGQTAQALQEPPAVEQTPVTFTTTTQSAAFGSNTALIAFRVDAAAHYQIGTNPTATTSTFPISADTEYVRAVKPGDKIAFVAA